MRSGPGSQSCRALRNRRVAQRLRSPHSPSTRRDGASESRPARRHPPCLLPCASPTRPARRAMGLGRDGRRRGSATGGQVFPARNVHRPAHEIGWLHPRVAAELVDLVAGRLNQQRRPGVCGLARGGLDHQRMGGADRRHPLRRPLPPRGGERRERRSRKNPRRGGDERLKLGPRAGPFHRALPRDVAGPGCICVVERRLCRHSEAAAGDISAAKAIPRPCRIDLLDKEGGTIDARPSAANSEEPIRPRLITTSSTPRASSAATAAVSSPRPVAVSTSSPEGSTRSAASSIRAKRARVCP